MNDTHPKISKMLDKIWRTKSGEERLIMGCSMHEFAQEIAVSSIRERKPHLNKAQIIGELFLHFYSHEFDSASQTKIYDFLVKTNS